MSAQIFENFEAFWEFLSSRNQGKNNPTYHPCCQTWVTRKNSKCRESHASKSLWIDVVRTEDPTIEDKKDRLRAHMINNQWGPPIRVNEMCTKQDVQKKLKKLILNSDEQSQHENSPLKLNEMTALASKQSGQNGHVFQAFNFTQESSVQQPAHSFTNSQAFDLELKSSTIR